MWLAFIRIAKSKIGNREIKDRKSRNQRSEIAKSKIENREIKDRKSFQESKIAKSKIENRFKNRNSFQKSKIAKSKIEIHIGKDRHTRGSIFVALGVPYIRH